MQQLDLTWIANGQTPKYRLRSDLTIGGYTIPAGFESDGASVPRLLRALVSPMGPYAPAAFLHDWMLQSTANRNAAYIAMSRGLDVLRVKPWRRWVIKAAVRLWDLKAKIF